MESIQNFDFFRLEFDGDGNPTKGQALDELKQHAQLTRATDAIFIAHGFRNSEQDATLLYTNFLTTFSTQMSGALEARLASRKFVVVGVYWPSKPFEEVDDLGGSAQALDDDAAEREAAKQKLEEMKATEACGEQRPKIERAIQLLDRVKGDRDTQDEFVALVLSLLDDSEADPLEGDDRIRATQGGELLDKLRMPIIVPTSGAGDSEGGVASAGPFRGGVEEGGAESLGSIVSSIYGRIGQFLNLTLWYVMKNRSGVVGGNGVAKAVREFKGSLPNIRVHLVGHSLGGRLMAACTKALAVPPMVRLDSLTLLEAAFSHFGFSPNNGKGQEGFFRSVVTSGVVKGPFLATFSMQDTVVGKVYAVASRLAGDNVQEIGDANDPYGGIGRNGAQRTAEAVVAPLRQAGSPPYQFQSGKIVNLDGSGGLIKNHGDVTNADVTFAFACAVAATGS
jgi:hypothetical protein